MELLESRRVLASTFAHQVIDLPLDGRSGVAMEVADLNADGLDDLIIGTGIGTVDVLFRDGDTFSNVQSLTVGGFVRSLTFADLDGDGRNADLVASTSEGLFFMLDQGSLDGSWQGYRLAGSTPQNNGFRVEVANLNGDAIDDLVYGVGVGFERDLSTQLGSGVDEEGNLSFGEPLTWQLRHKGSFVTVGVNDFDVGDVNQDGVDDIVATTPDVLIGVGLGGVNGSVFILTNDLQGGFDEQQFDGFAGAVNLFDFDLDGHLDILAGQPQQGQDAGGSSLPWAWQ